MNTCNQCHKEMPLKLTEDSRVCICDNPACPNFGLLQVSAEMMAEKLKEKDGEKYGKSPLVEAYKKARKEKPEKKE